MKYVVLGFYKACNRCCFSLLKSNFCWFIFPCWLTSVYCIDIEIQKFHDLFLPIIKPWPQWLRLMLNQWTTLAGLIILLIISGSNCFEPNSVDKQLFFCRVYLLKYFCYFSILYHLIFRNPLFRRDFMISATIKFYYF